MRSQFERSHFTSTIEPAQGPPLLAIREGLPEIMEEEMVHLQIDRYSIDEAGL